MGFFFSEDKKKKSSKKGRKKQDLSKIPQNLLREQACRVCSLKNSKGKDSGLSGGGDLDPIIHILGEMPGASEDAGNGHFTGDSGLLLRKTLKMHLPDFFDSARDLKKTNSISYDYCIRCKTPGYRYPTDSEIECCRKATENEIIKKKPLIVIGLGAIPLKWITGASNIAEWRGRRIPAKVGDHTFWFFPIANPSFLIKKNDERKQKYKNEYEKAFEQDIKNIATFLESDLVEEEPLVIDKDHTKGVKIYMGKSASDIKLFKKELDSLMSEPSLGIDIETDRLKPFGAPDSRIISVAIGTKDKTIAFPVDHPKAWQGKENLYKEVRGILENFLLEYKGLKICHQLKFELIWFLHYYGPKVLMAGKWADIMAQAYTIDNRTKKERNKGMLSLDRLCHLHLGFNLKPLSNLDRKNLINEPLDKVLMYNGMDSKFTHWLEEIQDQILEPAQIWTYEHLVRTARTLALTESAGVPVDLDRVEEFSEEYEEKLKVILKNLASQKSIKKFGRKYGEFNPASSDHVIILFRDVLGLKSVKGTGGDKDGYSTDNEVLKSFVEKGHEEADLILEFREIAKLKSTYIDSIDKVLFPDGLLHADYNHLFTSTGRFSSENPNMQNFPKRKNKQIREIIIPTDDDWIVAVDYGQLEARIIAMASQDRVFCEAIETGYDVHLEWAERIAKIFPSILKSVDGNMKELRQRTKNELVFPLFFGSSAYSVAKSLGLPDDKAVKLVKEFWGIFAGVKKWQATIQKFYDEHGYVETLTGARRYGPLSYNEMINAPIQGTASYVVVDGMNRLSEKAIEEEKKQYQARMNIHDDLTFFVPDKSLEEDIQVISEEMSCTDFDFVNVPLAVEISVGENWADIEEVAVYDTNDFREVVAKERQKRKRR